MDFTTPPYLLARTSVRRVMLQVLIGLLPGIAAYVWLLGPSHPGCSWPLPRSPRWPARH